MPGSMAKNRNNLIVLGQEGVTYDSRATFGPRGLFFVALTLRF